MSKRKVTILNKGLLPEDKGARDNFRARFGSWRQAPASNAAKFKKSNQKIELKLVKTEIDAENMYGDFYNFTEKFEIGMPYSDDGLHSSLEQLPDHSRFMKLLQSIKQNKKFEDYAASGRLPPRKQVDLPAGAGVAYEYNYLDKAYERVLSRSTTDIVEIPSMYAMVSEANTNTLEENSLQAPTIKQLYKNTLFPVRQKKFGNQMVVGPPATTIAPHVDNKFLFPMFSEIKVPMGRNKRIATDFQATNLAAILMRDIAEPTPLESKKSRASSFFIEQGTGRTTRLELESDTLDMVEYYMYDLGGWAVPSRLPKNSMFISEKKVGSVNFYTGEETYTSGISTQEMLATQDSDFSQTTPFGLGVESLRGKMDLILEEKARSFKDLLDGTLSYSEMFMFKISKFLGDFRNNNSAPVQNFYFYNAAETVEDASEQLLSFIDTQVKYDQQYSYVVSAYRAVVGTEYYYKGVKTDSSAHWAADGKIWSSFKVVSMPKIRLIEIPFFSSVGRIVAPPPYYPQVSIEQIKGITKGMLFSFDTQVGETYEEPVYFGDYEKQIVDQFLLDEKRSKDGKVLYRTVEAMSSVQVFRIGAPPEDYYDFDGFLLSTISTDADLASDLTAGSVARIIMQPPNKKFYYMFRALGFHGEPSNPSPVFEVELFNDGGVAYPVVNYYDFKEKDVKKFTKPLKNLLRITPRTSQAIVNQSASGLIGPRGGRLNAIAKNVVLGVEDETLFGKRFKIRLTSRDTGKKIDINMFFKTKVIRAPLPEIPIIDTSKGPPKRYDPMGLDLPTPDEPIGGFQILDKLGPTMEDDDDDVITSPRGGGGSGY